jgi:nucleoside-diphosphate-sugar epimerase
VLDALAAAGWPVVASVRSSLATDREVRVVRHSLGEPLDELSFDGASALVHCAWDLAATDERDAHRRNVDGSLELLHAARRAGVERLVFVSSIAAYAGCRSVYGRQKLEVEEAWRREGGHVLRPGLVRGGVEGGIFGRLVEIAGRVPVLVLPVPAHLPIYVVSLDDVVLLAVALLAVAPGASTTVAADSSPVPFGSLIRPAASRPGRPILLPLPWRPVYRALRIAERLGARLPFRSDSLLSLLNANPDPFADEDLSAADLGVGTAAGKGGPA